MTTLIALFNTCMTGLFAGLCWPFLSLDPIWAMIFISWLTGILMVWVFGKVSNQDAIRRVRDQIRGNLIGVRLFQHDVRVVLGLQGRILRHTLTYMRHSLFPMLVLIVPVVFIIIQLDLWFGARPLRVGEQALVKMTMREGAAVPSDVSLEPPDGIAVVETPAVRIGALREAVWRIRAEKPGRGPLVARSAGQEVKKDLAVGGRWGRAGSLRTGKSVAEMLLNPGEPPIDGSFPVQSVEVKYPASTMPLFGWNIHWLVWFFVLSIAFGFAFKGVLGVEV